MRTFCLMIFFACFSLAGCSAQKNAPTTDETDAAAVRGKWLVMSMRIDSNLQEVAPLDMYAEFDPNSGKVTGRGACNKFFGSLKLNGSQMTVGQLGGTMMACPELDKETLLLALLQQANHFSQDGERLLIQSGNKTLLEMIPYPVHNQPLDAGMAEINIPLDMYEWSFIEMVDADSTVSLSSSKANISFDPLNQKFQGFVGCNRFFGSMSSECQFNSGNIALGKIGSTRMACPQLALESKILAGLEHLTRYEIRNKSLLLFDHNKQVFRLRAVQKQD